MTTKNWEQEAKGLEEIDFAALADDEKAAFRNRIRRTLFYAKKALLAGECSNETAKRIVRAAERLTEQMYR